MAAAEKTGKTILLVEDDAVILIVEKKTLERNGFSVLTARNGREAVETANREKDIDLILMDIDLGPGMDGTEAAALILAERKLPIVFLSSHTEPEIVEKTEEITSYGYVVKASGETVLMASIKMAFRLWEATGKLSAGEEKMKSIFRAAPTGIGLVVNRVLKEVNERLCKMLGYSREELIDKSARILYPSQEDFEFVGKVKYERIAAEGTGSLETRMRMKNGAIIDVILSSTPLDTSDLSKGVTFTVLDITSRKKTEKELLQALEDKQSYLTELRHRVKNTLAMIASLVSLESMRSENEEVKDALSGIRGRVTSISTLYASLHREDDVGDVELGTYCKEIIRSIRDSLGTDDRGRIGFDLSCMKLRIDIKTATSLGLLINELITNALKHAFPDGRTGTISAGLEVRDGLVEVVISDDGVGLPKGFSPADSKGLGFQLASALAAQIGGTLEVAANDGAGGGTRIVVELPVPPPSRLPA